MFFELKKKKKPKEIIFSVVFQMGMLYYEIFDMLWQAIFIH